MAIEKPNQQQSQSIKEAKETLDGLTQELLKVNDPVGILFKQLLQTEIVQLVPMEFRSYDDFEQKGAVAVSHQTLPGQKTKIFIEIHPSSLKNTSAPEAYQNTYRRTIRETLVIFNRLKAAGAKF